eukprot:COSAG02_NODE_3207_length_7169_cov_2.626874_4_plen_353_part_00
MSLAQQAADMLASDEGFRNQFDRNHPDFHGDLSRVVDTGGSRVPEWGKDHANWKALAVREDEPKTLDSYGPEWDAAVELRSNLETLKNHVQGLCAPLEAVVKAQEKITALETLIESQAPPDQAEIDAAKEAPAYIAAEKFEGKKAGMAFGTGPQGVGYYSQLEAYEKKAKDAVKAEKANARKRKALEKQVAQCSQKLESTAVTTLRATLCCVDGTKFQGLRKKVERLIDEALKGGMSQQHYREKWSVALKRVTEEIFRAFSVTMLKVVKELKQKAIDEGILKLEPPPVVPAEAATVDAEKENSDPEQPAMTPLGCGEGTALVLNAEQLSTLKDLLAGNEKALSYLSQIESSP